MCLIYQHCGVFHISDTSSLCFLRWQCVSSQQYGGDRPHRLPGAEGPDAGGRDSAAKVCSGWRGAPAQRVWGAAGHGVAQRTHQRYHTHISVFLMASSGVSSSRASRFSGTTVLFHSWVQHTFWHTRTFLEVSFLSFCTLLSLFPDDVSIRSCSFPSSD